MLTKVFLKGKFTEQLSHLQKRQGETLAGQILPHPPGLPGSPGPTWGEQPGPAAYLAALASEVKALLGLCVLAVLWADPAPPRGAPAARTGGSTGAGLVLSLEGGAKSAQQRREN